jgi:imidazole glycerol-phosphate synthase subunit HisH
MSGIVIADYGVGNIFSVHHGFEAVGAAAKVAENPAALRDADRLVIPGVGDFANCMNRLERLGFRDEVLAFVETERPVLGICVGMQMLFDSSAENGPTPGLGLVPGTVERIPDTALDGAPVKFPNTGWSSIEPPEAGNWQGSVLAGLAPGDAMYFMHGYVPRPSDPSDRLATFSFHGHCLTAATRRDNLMGVQFHPERSAKTGLSLLARFAEL